MPANIGVSNVASQESSQDASDMQSNPVELPMVASEETVASSDSENLTDTQSSKKPKKSKLSFPGLDKSGVPISFTAADSSGGIGTAYFRERSSSSRNLSLVSGQVIKTESGAANIFISQTLDFGGNGLGYNPVVSYGQSGNWIPLAVSVTSTEITRQANGNYLLTAYIAVESEVESPIKITATANGRDLAEAPRQVVTRLVLDPSKTQVLAQAIYVVEQGASA